ncbi:hypothetical protein DFJ58DRAFT_846917 [Suillus subalutaceus]|uniref:uncharacterized protein n=1 Tax=Suillus subalutaceus TaxID=48586 RepID=UPI001B8705CF|nr:uncharacterized protein DFJ58DRAFT_846917 [Suillus subalutaceus]KAG1836498.1 hypothetical protein DFJ58DRAFT_846917 [Suillus subalutaceus]
MSYQHSQTYLAGREDICVDKIVVDLVGRSGVRNASVPFGVASGGGTQRVANIFLPAVSMFLADIRCAESDDSDIRVQISAGVKSLALPRADAAKLQNQTPGERRAKKLQGIPARWGLDRADKRNKLKNSPIETFDDPLQKAKVCLRKPVRNAPDTRKPRVKILELCKNDGDEKKDDTAHPVRAAPASVAEFTRPAREYAPGSLVGRSSARLRWMQPLAVKKGAYEVFPTRQSNAKVGNASWSE